MSVLADRELDTPVSDAVLNRPLAETDPGTWLRLATGGITWADAVAQGAVSASGSRADLSALLPLAPLRRRTAAG